MSVKPEPTGPDLGLGDTIVRAAVLRRLIRAAQALAHTARLPAADLNDAIAELATTARPAPARRAAYSVAEVVAFTGLSESTIYRYIRSCALPATKLGGVWMVPSDAVAELAKSGQRRSSPVTQGAPRRDVRDDHLVGDRNDG